MEAEQIRSGNLSGYSANFGEDQEARELKEFYYVASAINNNFL